MGWSMYLGFERDMVRAEITCLLLLTPAQGLSLWNINFLNERIIYELSPQEGERSY